MACALFVSEAHARPLPGKPAAETWLGLGADAWSERSAGGIRGLTVGPIESSRHPGVGYGSPAFERTLDEAVAMGATWVSLTPFGRVWDLEPTGVSLTFEASFEENREAIARAVRQAHDRGLRVFLVPHLWVESGGWRALIDPKGEGGWPRWVASYRAFLLTWAKLAEETSVDMLSVGVELRSWVTTERARTMLPLIEEVRGVYGGLLTYSANWDDVDDTAVLGALDLIGVNAFYPLAEREGAGFEELLAGGRGVAVKVERLAREVGKPVVFTEVGYTTRRDPAIKPWEWPDGMKGVAVDEEAQAVATKAILAPMLDSSVFAGFFVWRVYADPDDVSQEAEWGFSPRGKLAELVIRDAFTARWAADGPALPGDLAGRQRARMPGRLGLELAPELTFGPGARF